MWWTAIMTLQWRHDDRDGVSNQQPGDCILNCLFRRRSKKTSKLRVTGLCAGNSPVTMASYAENVSIWWRHHEIRRKFLPDYWPPMRQMHWSVDSLRWDPCCALLWLGIRLLYYYWAIRQRECPNVRSVPQNKNRWITWIQKELLKRSGDNA